MTGKIDLLDRVDSSGFIVADNGARVHFKSSNLFAYDIGRIAVGQVVSFDVKAGRNAEAINVCPQRACAVPDAKSQARRQESHTRYVGFDHEGSVRSYRFELNVPGRTVQTVIFQIDMRLLTKHQVVMQDGPNLCRHALLAQPVDPGSPALRSAKFVIGDRDILAYRASLPTSNAKHRHGLRRSHAAVAVSGA